MLSRMAPLLTRMARMARMLTRMTRWLATIDLSKGHAKAKLLKIVVPCGYQQETLLLITSCF